MNSDSNPPKPPLTYRVMHALMWPAMNAFRISCASAYQLSNAQMDRELTKRETTRLRMHLSMCGVCRSLPTQFLRMQDLLRCADEHEAQMVDKDLTLPDEIKERIATRLKEDDASLP